MSIKYELSRWTDYPGVTGLREQKLDVIAATGMTFTGCAQNIVLKREYTGKNTLEFDIPVRYIDDTTGTWMNNPFCKKLIEKTKIKLWRDERWWNPFGGDPTVNSETGCTEYPGEWQQGRWYDFVISSHKEKRSKKQLLYSYKCDSLFMNELSRNGYSLQFVADTDLMAANGMGTAHDLARRVVNGTDWEYVKTEVFPDYKEEFNPAIGETVKIPVATDQIEFVEGLDRYAYCAEVVVNDTTNQNTIKGDITRQLREQNINTSIAESRYGFSNNKFYWKPDSNSEKDYVYNHQKTNIVVSSAEPVILNDNGRMYYYIDSENTKPISVTTFNKSLNVWEMVQGTTTLYKRGSIEKDDFEVCLGLIPYNGSAAVVYKGYETNSINAGDLFAVKIATGYSNIDGNGLPSAISLNFMEAGNETAIVTIPINELPRDNNAFNNTYYVSVPKRITKPHFKIVVNSSNSVAIKAIYIYKLTGATKELDNTINSARSAASTQVNKITSLLGTRLTGEYNIEKNIIKNNDNTWSPIWLGFGQTASEGYDKAAQVYLLEFKENGKNYDVYLPINEKNAEIKRLSSTDNDKRRAISGEKSNRYSLLENIAKTFRCFTRFMVEHDAQGAIIPGTKRFTYVSELGKKQFHGFNYGVNLESIERSIDSENLITKMHVESIENQYNDSNMVTIQDSQYNKLGLTFLYNFNYYIKMGLLNKEDFLKEYNALQDFVGTRVQINLAEAKTYSPMIRKRDNLENEKKMLELSQNSLTTLANEELSYIHWDNFVQNSGIHKNKAYFPEIDISTFGQDFYKQNNNDTFSWKTSPNFKVRKYFYNIGTLAEYLAYNVEDGTPYKYGKNTTQDYPSGKNTWTGGLEKNQIQNSLEEVFNYQTQYKKNADRLAELAVEIPKVQTKIEEYENARNIRNNEIQSQIARFERKYSGFIIEGQWQGKDYVEADTFYLDATRAHAEACMPKVSYSIGAIDLSQIANPLDPEDTDWGKDFIYDVGDTTYVKDEELFGTTEQLTMVSSITSYIDSNKQDNLELRNYETRFEELFETIAASVTSVQLNENTWGKAANFMADETINENILQKSFAKNYNLVISSANNTVEQGPTGLTIRDNDTGAILRAIGGGIFFSKDGGFTFKTGITPDGVSASLITAGRIDTSKIVIRNDDTPLFNLDSQGLTAYRTLDNGGGMTRFDQFGIYSTENKQSFGIDWWKAKTTENAEQYIIDNSIFSLTKLGLNFKYEKGGLTLGTIETDLYGLKVVKDGEVVVKIDSNGNASFKGAIIATKLTLTATVATQAGIATSTQVQNAQKAANDAQKAADGAQTAAQNNALTFTTVELSNGTRVTQAKNKNGTVVSSTIAYAGSGYVLSSVGQTNSDKYVKIGTDGLLEANNAIIHGTMYANEGQIGGWKIASNALQYRDSEDELKCFLSGTGTQQLDKTVGTHTGKDWTIWSNGTFGVTNTGKLYATSGDIGGWTMDGDFFYKTNNGNMIAFDFGSVGGTKKCFAIGNISKVDGSWNNAKFAIDGQGKLYATDADISGKITADDGKIGGWTLDDSKLYAGSNSTNSSYFYILSEPDQYNGYIGAKDADDNWCFKVDYDGHLHATGATITGEIRASSINADCILKSGIKLGATGEASVFQDMTGGTGTRWYTRKMLNANHYNSEISMITVQDGAINTGRIEMYARRGESLGYYTGIKMEAQGAHTYGTWTDEGGNSDARIKHSIEKLSLDYDTFFDNLQPVRYKYIYGTSDRYHTGYIAQDVVQAINKTSLTTQDFAGACLGQNWYSEYLEGNTMWNLRYTEFIALNTWQIQKAKSRISELESRISELEYKLASLTNN